MEILRLCLAFLKIGAVSFGGGWTIVGLIRNEVVGGGMMAGEAFEEAVAIAQITPGPVALNVATLAGFGVGGWLGSMAATLSVLAVPLALLAGAGLLAKRLPIRKEALGEALAVGALSMTVMTTGNLLSDAGFSPRALAFSALSFLASSFTKLHPALIIVGCGALSLGWEAIAALAMG